MIYGLDITLNNKTINNKTELDIQEEFLLKQLENIKKLKQMATNN